MRFSGRSCCLYLLIFNNSPLATSPSPLPEPSAKDPEGASRCEHPGEPVGGNLGLSVCHRPETELGAPNGLPEDCPLGLLHSLRYGAPERWWEGAGERGRLPQVILDGLEIKGLLIAGLVVETSV